MKLPNYRVNAAIIAFWATFFWPGTVIQAQIMDGTVFDWGRNDYGQAAAPSGLTNVTAIAVGLSHTLALRDDGTVVGWGSGDIPSGLTNIAAIAAGQGLSLALMSNGTVWGSIPIPTGLTNVSAISANAGYCLALKRDGTVVSWGTGWNGTSWLTLNPPADLTNVVAIAAAQAHGVALRKDGVVVAWGDNTYDQTNVPATLTNVVAIAANQYKSLALNADGTLTAWGQAYTPPNETNAVAIASGAFHDLALRGDGSIIGWGVNSYSVTDIPAGLTNAIAVAAGGFNSAALANHGNVCFAARQSLQPTIYSGSTFYLVSGIADFPISSYQWQFNGTNLPNGTNRLLTLRNVPLSGAGNYSVIVSNLYGVAVSSNVDLCVTTSPPFIITQPIPQSVVPGTNTALSVGAGGSLPIYYQWQFNGTNINGATSNVLSFAAVLPADRGYYDVILSNAYGTVVSSNVFLHVLDAGDALNATNLVWLSGGDAPWFVENGTTYDVTHDGLAMQSGAITAGQESTIQTTVTGPGTLTYWWNVSSWPVTNYLEFSVNGLEQARIWAGDVSFSHGWEARTNYLGAGPQVLEWAFVKNDSRGNLDGWDSGWLDDVSYTPGGTAPFFTLNPTNQVVLVGGNASLNGAAQGTPPLSYQWQLNQVNIDGATSTNLSLTNVQFAVEGNYTLVISNAFGVTNSAPAFLNVVDFTEAANATNLVWNSGGIQPWFPETATTHDGVAALQSGAIAGGQQSALFTTVNGPGTLSFWWKVSSETNNDYASFSVDGIEQFRISGTVNWQSKTRYLTPGTHTLTWTYSKNATVNSGSDAAWLDQISYVEGTTAAFIASNPTDQVVALLSNVTFAVLAQGTPPLSYQWFFDNNNITDATNATLTITNVQITDVGGYTVAVTNDYGGVISANANLYLLSVYAWGAGRSNTLIMPNFGQSMVPTNLASVTAIAAGGYHNLALLPNGSVKAWGYNNYGETNVPTTLTNAMAIAAGVFHSLALRSNGTVTAWGNSTYSQTTVPTSATNITAIAAGAYHNLALRSNGTVVAWGAGTSLGTPSPPYSGQSMVPSSLTGVKAIAAGGYHSLALRTNGTVVAWGWNASGQTNVPSGLSNVIAIAAGVSNSIALKNDGTLVAWGDNSVGIPDDLSNVVAIAAGAAHNMALKNDGTLVLWGLNRNGQTNAQDGLTNIVAISAGAYHSTVLVNDRIPRIYGQIPAPKTYTGSTILLHSGIVGAVPMSYQWQFNGTNLDAATNAALTLTNVAFSAAGSYNCVASNAYGVITNSNMTLSVLRSTLQFLPASLSMTTNGSFAFILGSLSGHGSIIIYHSTNLIDWQPICTNAPVIGTLPFADSSAKNSPIKIYRAVEQ